MSFRTAALILAALLVPVGLAPAARASGAPAAHGRAPARALGRCVCVHRAAHVRRRHRRTAGVAWTARAALASADRRWTGSWTEDWAASGDAARRVRPVRTAVSRPWDTDRAGYLTWPGKFPISARAAAPVGGPAGGPGAPPPLDRY